MGPVWLGDIALRGHRLCWVGGVMTDPDAVTFMYFLGICAVLALIGLWLDRKKRNRWVKRDAWKPTGSHPSFWSTSNRGRTMCR